MLANAEMLSITFDDEDRIDHTSSEGVTHTLIAQPDKDEDAIQDVRVCIPDGSIEEKEIRRDQKKLRLLNVIPDYYYLKPTTHFRLKKRKSMKKKS